MDKFTSVIGWIVIAAITVGLAAGLCSVLVELSLGVMDRLKDIGAAEERVRLHRNLLSGSHWFSEHPPTSELMQIYANRVAQYGETNVSEIRDEWRRQLKLQRQIEEDRPF